MTINKKTYALLVLLLLGSSSIMAQSDPVVTAKVDTASIRIGEQVNYEISLAIDSSARVVFPEGQTFQPMEVIESYKADTSFAEAKMKLIKKYGLTQFDSGSYRIPQQRILINEKEFLTDTFRIEVDNVVVDTTVQKLYDIKPAIELPKDFSKIWRYLSWILPILLAIGGFIFWLLRRNKKRAEAEKYLPPFEQALVALKELDEKGYLQNNNVKGYYTELTDTVRKYYDEKVYDRSLESTTDELIDRLQLERDSGTLDFTPGTIATLQDILKRADLVKFARILPPEGKPQADRMALEEVVKETREILPEPTEEELLKDEAYRLALARKRKRKLLLTGAAGILGILIIALGISIATKGYANVRDFVFGNQTRELAEGNWITSTYGYPPLIISTPEVLVRQQFELPDDIAQQLTIDVFGWESKKRAVSVAISQSKYATADIVDIEKIVDGNLRTFESQGFEFNIVKSEEFTTPKGAEGAKTYGNGTATIRPGSDKQVNIEYTILTFNAGSIVQQVLLTWLEDDEYSQQIARRIIASVELEPEQPQQ